ncbi:MAG: 50S ribosomal protein L11 methyltransferase [Alphaproteobacteria bacterium]|nr:50S ribosomal protein L11 methyltransferase [Alphaproteobacteria bacterium]
MTKDRRTEALWLLMTIVPESAVAAFSSVLEEDAAALTVMDSSSGQRIEVLYGSEPDRNALRVRMALLAAALGIDPPVVTIAPAPQKDWLRVVAQGVPQQKIARWLVGDIEARANRPAGRYAVALDAATAFGSGTHPTTTGCLELLDRALRRGFLPERVADIGCGSGILALACVRATRAAAVCVDNDRAAVRAARRNVRQSGFGGRLFVCHGCGYAPALVRAMAPYDAIMANIFSSPLCALAAQTAQNLRPGGLAFLSGMLTSQTRTVIAAHRLQGFSLLDRWEKGGWAALAFIR